MHISGVQLFNILHATGITSKHIVEKGYIQCASTDVLQLFICTNIYQAVLIVYLMHIIIVRQIL